jgi:acyl-CoA hydrolase
MFGRRVGWNYGRLPTDERPIGIVCELVGGQKVTVSASLMDFGGSVADGQKVPTDDGPMGIAQGVVGGQKVTVSGDALDFGASLADGQIV